MALNPAGFVSRNGKQFWCGERPHHFIGVTNFGLIINTAAHDSNAAVDEVFGWCNTNNIRVVRCWGFLDGPTVLARSFQNPRGTFNSTWWAGGDSAHGMDWVIKKATDYNVRLIIPLNLGFPEEWGGMKQYAQWGVDAALFAGPASSQKHQFISHTTLKTWFKTCISTVLNRVNSLTGVAYKNDPAIFSWHLCGEVENNGRPVSEYMTWVTEMAAYVKSIDSNHLLASGMTGFDDTGTGGGTPYSAHATFYNGQGWPFDGTKGQSFSQEILLSNIDYGVVHCYPNAYFSFSDSEGDRYIREKIAICDAANKPCVIEEFGSFAANRGTVVYPEWLDEVLLRNGSAILWQFQTPSDIQGPDSLSVEHPSLDADDTDVKAEIVAQNAAAIAKNIYESPTLASLSPNTKAQGSGNTSVTLTGTKFTSATKVRVNGSDRTTVYVSPTSIIGTVTTADHATAGTKTLTAFTPTPGGGTSSGQTYTIESGETPLVTPTASFRARAERIG